MSKLCPCGSGREYLACCGPIIAGTAKAQTAEALMRSRYSAYVKGAVDYIMKSCVEDEGIDAEATRNWSEKADWKGLTIVRTEKGGPSDNEGIVEFVANYVMDGLKDEHKETARFIKKDGTWLYESGDVKTATVVRAGPKVGRNEPCPCGSGKKYKQCCGK
ncbi:MAG: YchJ family protein [Spirochaetia bacterium]|jgi:SEC-C motif-containing protein|nr:YchJ family protein [Spirochaetia bacterium]